jgi:hypothetical protein
MDTDPEPTERIRKKSFRVHKTSKNRVSISARHLLSDTNFEPAVDKTDQGRH